MTTHYQMMAGAEHASDAMFQRLETEDEQKAAATEEAEAQINLSEILEEIEINFRVQHQAMRDSLRGDGSEFLWFARQADVKLVTAKAIELLRAESERVSSAMKAPSPCGLSEATPLGATQARTLSQLIDLLYELLAAHLIIQNALNLMTVEQKREWSLKNARDAVHGEGITRTNERESVLINALKAAYGEDVDALNTAKVREMLAKTTGGLQ